MSLLDPDATPYAIPGPAGLPRARRPTTPTTPSSGACAAAQGGARFATPAWHAALALLQSPLRTSLATLRARALAGDLSKAPALPVLLAALKHVGKDAVVTLADPTASIPATLHAAALEQHANELRPGAVLLLADISALAVRSKRVSGFRQDPAAAIHISVDQTNITQVVVVDPDAMVPLPADPLLAYAPSARAPVVAKTAKRASRKRPRAQPLMPMRTGGPEVARPVRQPPPRRMPQPPRPPPPPPRRVPRPPPPVVSDEMLDDLLGEVDIDAAIAASGLATQAATQLGPPTNCAPDDDNLLDDLDVDAVIAASGRATQLSGCGGGAGSSGADDCGAGGGSGQLDEGLGGESTVVSGACALGQPQLPATAIPPTVSTRAVATGPSVSLSRPSSVLDLVANELDEDLFGKSEVEGMENPATPCNKVPVTAKELPISARTCPSRDLASADKCLEKLVDSGMATLRAAEKENIGSSTANRASKESSTGLVAIAGHGGVVAVEAVNSLLVKEASSVFPAPALSCRPAAAKSCLRKIATATVPDDDMIGDLTDDLGDDDFADF